ncbi:importin subunit beta-1-like [Saccostrea echinata]|uniref:importin subunit beta-1-like n=1 Tax=Saccostrea echinata TaxID=191078 RepID=UPI002A8072C8|nr:importin subunit beta-1-like [Saccostrea echinata]
MDLLSVLEHTLLPDQKVLDDAQQVLEQAAQSDLHGFLTSLSGILNNIANSNAGRTQAGLQLKNPLYLNDSGINAGYQQRWLSLPEEVRGRVKTIILASLGTEPISPSTAAQCVAYIACAELPSGLWPNLIALLVINVTNQNTTEELKEASLEAIGYICQDIDQAVLQSKSNEILTAILHGMRQEQPSNRVRVAAAKALWNSLEYLKANFDKETERHFIMQVVCEATKSPDTKVKGAALQCLVKIASLYYKQMDSYMGPALTSITMEAMKSDVDEIAFQGIEFWSNVCEKEIALATGLSEAAEQGMPSERGSRFYIQGASMYLCPILLQTLTKQVKYLHRSDDVDNDEWSIGRAAGVCLRLIATERKDNIVPLISPFVIGNISDGNWRYRVAAVMALGSILEGPDPEMLQPIVRHVMPMLIQLLNDLNIIGRITTAQIMRRICKIVPKPIITGHQVLPSFLSALMNGLTAGPTVASQFCWTISSLAEAAYVSASPEGDPSTYCLSTSFATIVENLIQVTDRSDGNQHNLRNAAFEALTEMIKNSPKDCYGIVQKTAIGVLEKLDRLLHMKNKIQVPTDRAQYNELQFLICDTLQSVLKKLTRQDALRISDQVMGVLLRMFTTGVQEDALLTVSTLVEVLGGNFANYVDAFKPSLIASLKNSEEHSVCLAAIGLVRNLCQALGRMMSPYCDEIMLLLENLWNSNLHRSVKPHLLSVFGEIALAIGPDFKKFLTKVMTILHQASQEKVEKTDLDMIDYLNDIRQGCLEAYTGIVQCFREGGKLDDVYLLLPYISQIMSFIENVAMDEDHSMENISACCGLIADLCTVLGVRMLPYVDKGTIQGLVTKGLNSSTKRVRNVAMWATQEINKLKSISW